MRYSLRTLLIALCVLPLLLALVFWMGWPEPGSPESMREFLSAIDTSDEGRIERAARNCFIVGSPAKTYESTWGKLPPEELTRSGTNWVFSTRGDFVVMVAIGGNPEVVQSVKVVRVLN